MSHQTFMCPQWTHGGEEGGCLSVYIFCVSWFLHITYLHNEREREREEKDACLHIYILEVRDAELLC